MVSRLKINVQYRKIVGEAVMLNEYDAGGRSELEFHGQQGRDSLHLRRSEVR